MKRSDKQGVAQVVWLASALALLSLGCAVSKESFKSNFKYEPVRAAGKIDGKIKLEASHTLPPELIDKWKRLGNPQENVDNWREAIADTIREDMVRSGLFDGNGLTNSPDLILKVESFESETPEHRLRIALFAIEPLSKTVIVKYEREADLGTSIFAYADNMRNGLASLLDGLRQDLLGDYQAGKLRTIVAAARTSHAAQAHLAAVQAAEAQGDYATALRTLRQALTADPKSPAPVAAAVAFLHRLCDPEGAKQLAAAAEKAHPADPALQTALAGTGVTPHAPACEAQALNRDGVALARERKLPEALAKFQAARQRAPGLVPKASYNAALLLEQAGKPREAVQAYLEAHRGFLTPADQQEALTRLVALAQRANLPAPDAADRRYRLGIVRAQQKRYPEAVTEFEAAVAEAPWLVDAYYNLGLVYDFTNAPAPALQALRTYLALAPQSPQASAVKTKIVELEDKLGVLPPAGK